jgi:hypothetical protein
VHECPDHITNKAADSVSNFRHAEALQSTPNLNGKRRVTLVAETAAEAYWSRLMIKRPGVRGRYGQDHEGEPGEDRESRGDVLKALHLFAPFACEDFQRHEIVDDRRCGSRKGTRITTRSERLIRAAGVAAKVRRSTPGQPPRKANLRSADA